MAMPEGHTIHRLARDHQKWFAKMPVAVASPQGTFADAAARLDGLEFARAEAYGKHLFHRYADGSIVHIHLGLFGKVFHHDLADSAVPVPRDTVRYRVVNRLHGIDLIGATQCELITPSERDAIVERLGPDPLRPRTDHWRGYAALRRRTVAVGQSLMDQRVIAGVGNVYRAELLFVHGIHPEVPSRTITEQQWESMWSQLQTWMRHGVRTNRIVTVDVRQLGWSRKQLAAERATYVYRQEHCRKCGTLVRRWDMAGRWAYACETCQPPP
ncbi:MAG: DNA-formamidopyrimidine glycosylase family protein [Nitriliruptoraceae bacterium]